MFRRVVDLRRLKSVSKTPKFQYESISTDGDQVRPLDPLIPLAIKNGFHHILVHLDDRKLLGINWKGHWYEWTVDPFRVNGIPYFFCQTLRPVNQHLRQQGYDSSYK